VHGGHELLIMHLFYTYLFRNTKSTFMAKITESYLNNAALRTIMLCCYVMISHFPGFRDISSRQSRARTGEYA